MDKIGYVVGTFAVIFYFLGYLQKNRKRIIILNSISRFLYVLQYILLGAYAGALLDVAGIVSSLLANNKDKPFIKKHVKLIFISVDLLIVAAGIFVSVISKDVFGALPIIGVLLHTSAFWMDDEKRIRQVSLLGSPFWLAYNIIYLAPAMIGDILSMISIVVSMIRYDIKPRRNKNADN